MSIFTCQNCQNHAQELREMRIAHESEKEQIRRDHKEQLDRQDALIKDLHDRLMSRDIQDLETAKNPPVAETITQEDDPYVDLQAVPDEIPKQDIEKALGNN